MCSDRSAVHEKREGFSYDFLANSTRFHSAGTASRIFKQRDPEGLCIFYAKERKERKERRARCPTFAPPILHTTHRYEGLTLPENLPGFPYQHFWLEKTGGETPKGTAGNDCGNDTRFEFVKQSMQTNQPFYDTHTSSENFKTNRHLRGSTLSYHQKFSVYNFTRAHNNLSCR